MIDLSKFDCDCSKERTRPIYKKRYKKNGEEYLEKVDEIDIEESMHEINLELTRLQEIFNTQERLKTEELINEEIDDEYLQELEELANFDIDTTEFLNKTNELKEFYNKMPSDIRKQYSNLAKFSKEYLPKFIEEKSKMLEENKKTIKEEQKQETNEQIQQQIEELQNKLKGDNENV